MPELQQLGTPSAGSLIMSDQSDKVMKAGGPGMIILGAVFMGTSNVALGAAFIAIGAALIAKQKKDNDAS